jgi:hypothetical protein
MPEKYHVFFVDSREKAHYLVHPPIVTVTMQVTVVVTSRGFPICVTPSPASIPILEVGRAAIRLLGGSG